MDDEELRIYIAGKRGARMHEIDKLPQDIRSLVHEYGYSVVKSFMDCGVKKPKHIRHLVETVLNEFSPSRGSYSIQGVRKDMETGKAKPQ